MNMRIYMYMRIYAARVCGVCGGRAGPIPTAGACARKRAFSVHALLRGLTRGFARAVPRGFTLFYAVSHRFKKAAVGDARERFFDRLLRFFYYFWGRPKRYRNEAVQTAAFRAVLKPAIIMLL